MTEFTDITGTLEPGMWDYRVFPGLDTIIPALSIETMATIGEHGFFGSRIVTSTITGTYLEAGSHVLPDGRTLDTYGVADFIRPVKLLRLGTLPADSLIDRAMLEAASPRLQPGDALLIDTGWYARWNTPGYVEHCPKMLPSALEWLLERRIGLLGVDVPAIEAAWSEGDDSAKGGLLARLFAQGCLLLAPVIALDRIDADHGRLIALPLPLKGTSGAPVRVIVEWEKP